MMEMKSASEQMIKFLEDKIEDMAITIFDLRLEVKILTDVIRDLENELRAKE
jgi:hypothetical protein